MSLLVSNWGRAQYERAIVGLPLHLLTNRAHQRTTTFLASNAATWTIDCMHNLPQSQTCALSLPHSAYPYLNLADPRRPVFPLYLYAAYMSSNNKARPVQMRARHTTAAVLVRPEVGEQRQANRLEIVSYIKWPINHR